MSLCLYTCMLWLGKLYVLINFCLSYVHIGILVCVCTHLSDDDTAPKASVRWMGLVQSHGHEKKVHNHRVSRLCRVGIAWIYHNIIICYTTLITQSNLNLKIFDFHIYNLHQNISLASSETSMETIRYAWTRCFWLRKKRQFLNLSFCFPGLTHWTAHLDSSMNLLHFVARMSVAC